MLPTLRSSRYDVGLPESFAGVRQEMDELFDRLFGGRREETPFRAWFAPLSLWEDQGQVCLEIELPGISQEDVDLTIQNGTLHITAERKGPEQERTYWHNERRFGRMERFITMPQSVEADSIDARLEHGVLRVTLNKKPEAQAKRISVKGS